MIFRKNFRVSTLRWRCAPLAGGGFPCAWPSSGQFYRPKGPGKRVRCSGGVEGGWAGGAVGGVSVGRGLVSLLWGRAGAGRRVGSVGGGLTPLPTQKGRQAGRGGHEIPLCLPLGGGVAGKVDTKKVPIPFFSGLSLFFLYYFCGCHSPYAACLTVEFLLSLAACLPAKRGGWGPVPATLGVGCPAMGLARDQSRTLPAPLPGPPGPYLPLKVSCYPLTPTKP